MRLAALLALLGALSWATQAGRTVLPLAAGKVDREYPFGRPLPEAAHRHRDAPDFDSLVQLIESAFRSADSERLIEPPPEPFSPVIAETEVHAFLIECLRQILEDRSFQRQRDFYGTPGDDVVVLIDDSGWPWPANMPRALGGYRLQFGSSEMRVRDVSRRMAIRLDELDVMASHRGFLGVYDGNAQLCIHSLPGTGSTLVSGGCLAWFNLERVDGQLSVSLGATLDP